MRAGMPQREGWEEDDVMPIVDVTARRTRHRVRARCAASSTTPSTDSSTSSTSSVRASQSGWKIVIKPVWHRAAAWSASAQAARVYWPFYSVSIVAPAIVAAAGLIRDRRATWLYHPVINFALGVEFWRRALPYAWSVARARLRGQRA